MKKRTLSGRRRVAAAAFALVLLFALAGCSSSGTSNASSAADRPSASQQKQAVVQVDIEGMGAIAWAYQDGEPTFDEEQPSQSAYIRDAYGQTIHIEARENASYEGYRFVKWNKDGTKFSNDKRIDVEVDGDAKYVAVFEFVDGDGNVVQSVDYGDSEIYTQEDIDAAIDVVMAEFDTWTGAQMKRIVFAGDAACETDLEYCNSLRDAGDPEFSQAIVFSSDFHSPSDKGASGTAWEADTDYEDYSWHLARTDGGTWKLLTWGYA